MFLWEPCKGLNSCQSPLITLSRHPLLSHLFWERGCMDGSCFPHWSSGREGQCCPTLLTIGLGLFKFSWHTLINLVSKLLVVHPAVSFCARSYRCTSLLICLVSGTPVEQKHHTNLTIWCFFFFFWALFFSHEGARKQFVLVEWTALIP